MSRTSAVGTWVLNEEFTPGDRQSFVINATTAILPSLTFTLLSTNNNDLGAGACTVLSAYPNYILFFSNGATKLPSLATSNDGDYVTLMTSGTTLTGHLKSSENGLLARTLTITGGDDAEDPDLIAWLEANATYVESNIEVPMTSPDGVTLATKGKYVPANVKVTPTLQEKTVTESGDVTPDDGYVGLSKVTVNVESSLTSAEGVEF